MSNALERFAERHPLVKAVEVIPREPGVQQIVFEFTNGRGASVITGPSLIARGMDRPGWLEIAALAPGGKTIWGGRENGPTFSIDDTTSVIGDDVRRGTPAQIEAWILALADLPPKDEEPLTGRVLAPLESVSVLANMKAALELMKKQRPWIGAIPGEIISTAADGTRMLCANCDGTGRLPGDRPCFYCKTTGELGPLCPDCGGSGYGTNYEGTKDWTCTTCDGKGGTGS